MEQNVVERNPFVSFLLGMGVILAMSLVGERLGIGLLEYGVPYGGWLGVGVGAVTVFILFAIVYTRFDSVYGERF